MAALTFQGRIEICGGIASGKTTFARALARRGGAPVALERFEVNPLWSLFYRQPTLFVREKNISFLTQHTGEIKEHQGSPNLVCDYAVFQDLAYASLLNDSEHLNVMESVYNHLYKRLDAPVLLIHLRCEPEVQLRRIHSRNRSQELTITRSYLDSLNNAIEFHIRDINASVPVRHVESGELDFATDEQTTARLCEDLLTSIWRR